MRKSFFKSYTIDGIVLIQHLQRDKRLDRKIVKDFGVTFWDAVRSG